MLAWLRRCNDRMSSGTRMFGRVTIGLTVAAERIAALLARAKMHPRRTNFNAFGALANFRLFHGLHGVEMTTTTIRHNYFRLLFEARRR